MRQEDMKIRDMISINWNFECRKESIVLCVDGRLIPSINQSMKSYRTGASNY